eukprot:9179076-Pyramimonas_sp.AAC.1
MAMQIQRGHPGAAATARQPVAPPRRAPREVDSFGKFARHHAGVKGIGGLDARSKRRTEHCPEAEQQRHNSNGERVRHRHASHTHRVHACDPQGRCQNKSTCSDCATARDC